MPTEAANAPELLMNGRQWSDRVYLNTAAEGLPLRACNDAVHRYMADKATGEPGRVAMWAVHERARHLAADLFGVESKHIALVSSTTEALNTVAHGIDWRTGDEVVFTAVEFPSNMCPWVVAARQGVHSRVVHPRNGLVSIDDILEAITPQTRLVTVSQVSYATGQHLDLTPIWERVRGTDTLLCIDATQAAGRVPVRADQADFVVASAFKWLNSIHGAAILSASDRVLERGILGPAGWFSAETCYADDRLERFHPRPDAGRFHAGMPNFDAVYSLVAALEYHGPQRVAQRQHDLRPLVGQLWNGLRKLDLPLLTPGDARDQAGIVGIACPESAKMKRQLAESGIHIHGDDGRLRAAVHWYNTPEQIDRFLATMRQLI